MVQARVSKPFGVMNIVDGEDSVVYTLKPSYTEIRTKINADGTATPATPSPVLSCGYVKAVGGTLTTVAEVAATTSTSSKMIDGTYNLYFRRRTKSSQSWSSYYKYRYSTTYTNYLGSTFNLATYDMVEFVISNQTAATRTTSTIGTIVAQCTVPVVYDGDATPVAHLTVAHASIPVLATGYTDDVETVTTVASLSAGTQAVAVTGVVAKINGTVVPDDEDFSDMHYSAHTTISGGVATIEFSVDIDMRFTQVVVDLEISGTVNGTSITRTLSLTVTAQQPGADGDPGNGILSVTTTYALSKQGTTASETTAPVIVGSWSSTQPRPYSTLPYLWSKVVTVWSQSGTDTRYRLVAAAARYKRTPVDGGKWADLASSDSFTVTDTQTYYFENASGSKYVYVGDNGTFTKSSQSSAFGTAPNWELVNTEYGYYIAEATIANFGKFGGSVFNGDFQFSQHGWMLGFEALRTEIVDPDQYQYADPTDMFGDIPIEQGTLIWNTTSAISTTSTSWYQTSLSFTAQAGRWYSIYIAGKPTASGSVSSSATTDWKIATSSSAAAVVEGSFGIGGEDSVVANFKVATAGTYRLFIKTASGTTGSYSAAELALCKFIPKYVANMLTGRVVPTELPHASVKHSMIESSTLTNRVIVDKQDVVNVNASSTVTQIVLPAPDSSRAGATVEVYNPSASGVTFAWVSVDNSGDTLMEYFRSAKNGLNNIINISRANSYNFIHVKFFCDGENWWVLEAESAQEGGGGDFNFEEEYASAFGTAVSSGSYFPVITSASEPSGRITAANLRNVIQNGIFGSSAASISSGADLNSITSTRAYRSSSSTITNSLSNCPVTGAGFILWNISYSSTSISTYGVQVIFVHTGSIWIRFRNSSWGKWVRLVHEDLK